MKKDHRRLSPGLAALGTFLLVHFLFAIVGSMWETSTGSRSPAVMNSALFLGLLAGIMAGAVVYGLRWRALRRRPQFPACRYCGYNLTGNTSGRCPECGQPIRREGNTHDKS